MWICCRYTGRVFITHFLTSQSSPPCGCQSPQLGPSLLGGRKKPHHNTTRTDQHNPLSKQCECLFTHSIIVITQRQNCWRERQCESYIQCIKIPLLKQIWMYNSCFTLNENIQNKLCSFFFLWYADMKYLMFWLSFSYRCRSPSFSNFHGKKKSLEKIGWKSSGAFFFFLGLFFFFFSFFLLHL